MNINSTFAHESCASIGNHVNTGIDKLSLSTKEYTIRDGQLSGLKLKPATVDLATGEDNNIFLFKDGNGKTYHGSNAFRNDELFSVNINQYGLNVIFNPSKPYHPYELCADDDMLLNRTETVFKRLKSFGILTNYSKMKVNRIDLARNSFMKHSCNTYQPIFSGLTFTRSKRQAQYPDGYSTNNNSFGLTFYNKGLEALTNHTNLLRAELQYKKSDGKRFKELQVYCMDDIHKAGMDQLNQSYVSIMQNEIFKVKDFSGQVQLTFADKRQELECFQKQYGKNKGILNFIISHGVENLVSAFGGMDGYRTFLKNEGFHRNTIYKYIKQAHSILNLRSQMTNSKHYGKLYRELILSFAS